MSLNHLHRKELKRKHSHSFYLEITLNNI